MILTRPLNQEIDPEDHATLDALGPAAYGDGLVGGRTLADMIFSKMEGGAVSKGIEEEGGSFVCKVIFPGEDA